MADGVEVYAGDGRITVWGATIDAARLTDELVFEDELLDQARDTLDRLQTEIAHNTTEPWPARAGRGYRGGLPVPHAELVEDRLHLWFGPRDHPILKFTPLDFGNAILLD